MNRALPWLSLFSATGTLLCCALPALFVTLGAGGALVSLLGAVPQLIWLSEHKLVTFGVPGALLALGAVLLWRARNDVCPIDERLALACQSTRRNARIVFTASLVVYGCGATFAFLIPALT